MQYFKKIVVKNSCESFGKPKGLNMNFGEFFFIFGKIFSHAEHDQHDR